MTSPNRYLTTMTLFIGAIIVLLVGLALTGSLYSYFMGNAPVNGLILLILVAGSAYIFRQVAMLNPEVAWIERFRRNQVAPGHALPRLLAPMATMLADRRSGRVSLSALSMRTLLDGVATRLDDARETSRYLSRVLIFLGLLGTFYGLLELVQSVSGVIGGLDVSGSADAARAFGNFKSSLQQPLAGMSTAFSASLFGLGGFLVLGFLDLQAGHAMNRFYHELEEYLSSYTRLSGGGPGGDAGETSVPAFIQALLEQTADSLDNLQRILGRGEESRISANANVLALTERLSTLTDQMRAEQSLMLKLAETQVELRPVLSRLAEATASGPPGQDEARAHLRNIEIYLARLAEDVAQGRGESTQEIRGEIRLLARTIAALAEEERS